MGFTETPTTRPYAPTTIFPYPTPITSQWTTSLKHELSPSYTLPPGASPATLSFEQLKAAYTHDNIIKDLGKLGAEDPHKQSSLAYANLRENRSARRHLAGLNLARGHIYGVRAFGPKH